MNNIFIERALLTSGGLALFVQFSALISLQAVAAYVFGITAIIFALLAIIICLSY